MDHQIIARMINENLATNGSTWFPNHVKGPWSYIKTLKTGGGIAVVKNAIFSYQLVSCSFYKVVAVCSSSVDVIKSNLQN